MTDPASRDREPLAPILAVTAHARSVSSTERERLAGRVRNVLRGGLVVNTCHRVEAYATTPEDIERIAGVPLPRGSVAYHGERAVRHAIAVAAGRDSVVIGEDQILHQLRQAVDRARTARRLDPVLERLFASALRAGRIARSRRRGPQHSLATVALLALEREIGSLRGRPVLVVGAGQMGRLAARAAAEAGAAVTVSNRSAEAAGLLAKAVDATLAPFDPGPRVAACAAIIVALSGPWVIGADTVRAIADSQSRLVDLSVPSAVPRQLGRTLGGRMITADHLARLELDGPDERHLRRIDSLVDEATAEFIEWLSSRDRRAVAAALAGKADRARQAELAALWRRLPDLDSESRAAIDAMTRHLAQRLLQEPLERLGRDTDGRAERAVRETFAL